MTDETPEVVEEPQFTAADDWPDEDGAQVLTLPSGAVVRVSPPPVVWLALTGRVPANLVAIQKHHIADGKSWTPAELDEALDWLIAESFEEPKVSVPRKKGYRHIASISRRDKEVVVVALKLQQYIGVLG